MNPIEKWQAKKRMPYKFMVQVIKIFLVTLQLCLFAFNRYHHINYTWDNRVTFSHLFLKGWDATREVNAYPPGVGPLAVYKIEDFYAAIDYAFDGYSNLSKAVGSYSYASEDNSMIPMQLCLERYKKGVIFGFNESYVFDSEIVVSCTNITHDLHNGRFDSKKWLASEDIEFASLVKVSLNFSLKTVNFKAAGRISAPNCYRFDINIVFDNEDHDGQILLSLDAEPHKLMCKAKNSNFVVSSVGHRL